MKTLIVFFQFIIIIFCSCSDSTKVDEDKSSDKTPPSVVILQPADGLIVTEPLTIKVDTIFIRGNKLLTIEDVLY
jgi:hypothetical protein